MESINPDIETLKLTLWIAGSVIGLMLAVIAFFLRKQVDASETLTKAVSALTNAVTILETQNSERAPVVERRLNEHARRLDEHEVRITVIETKLKIKKL